MPVLTVALVAAMAVALFLIAGVPLAWSFGGGLALGGIAAWGDSMVRRNWGHGPYGGGSGDSGVVWPPDDGRGSESGWLDGIFGGGDGGGGGGGGGNGGGS